jgi:hypothetical protein
MDLIKPVGAIKRREKILGWTFLMLWQSATMPRCPIEDHWHVLVHFLGLDSKFPTG